MVFAYGETELAWLRKKDKRLGEVIDLFSAVIHHIIGQQISMKAQATIWQRMQDALGAVSAETILAAGVPELQSLGMTFRKAEYITDFAEKVHTGAFDLDAVAHMRDADAIRALSSQPLPLGRLRRRDPGAEGLQAEKQTGGALTWSTQRNTPRPSARSRWRATRRPSSDSGSTLSLIHI